VDTPSNTGNSLAAQLGMRAATAAKQQQQQQQQRQQRQQNYLQPYLLMSVLLGWGLLPSPNPEKL